ncbi:adenylate/guanylate cyclase domain-containing protein, partial [Treponema sp. OttesenSCG-928-L16]|nr:adenylate/guanylate cyclase domain-containing protein [Treponema sp. OttesenSCG-928-L16]
MSQSKKYLFTALLSAALFSLLYFTSFFSLAEDRIYDMFLRVKPNREETDKVVFLDVDDQAVAHVGVFPWPRSVVADGLLLLKEFGAAAAIFDIEYIDKSPSGINEVYMQRGLETDFNRTFSDIGDNVSDLFRSMGEGWLSFDEALEYASYLGQDIADKRDSLMGKVSDLALDNDEYLAQSARLYGHVWATINLQQQPLSGEQAERRALAETKFSYPVDADPGAPRGNYADILPPIPSFMEAARGAGFTNVTIDGDGVRRRIYLTREVQGRWYLQLAFAPLMELLGRPSLSLKPGRLDIIGAEVPGAGRKNISIPLDKSGAMMLDWPPENYLDSFSHISFAELSHLGAYENKLDQYIAALAASSVWTWPDEDNLMAQVYTDLRSVMELMDWAAESRNTALRDNSEAAFDNYVSGREELRKRVRSYLDSGAASYAMELAEFLGPYNPGLEDQLIAAAAEAADISGYVRETLDAIETIRDKLSRYLPEKLCILGRVDTGTTDIGVNPFYGEYVNVGTHGVVLDTILAQSFIRPLSSWWSILAAFILVPLFMLLFNGLKPGFRAGLGFLGVVLLLALCLVLFVWQGIFLGPLGPALALLAAVIAREIIAFVGSEQEKQFIRKAFSTYLSGDVVQQILADPSKLQLGGSKRHMSAIFTDVKGFSTISEQLDPEDLVRLLNSYLSTLSNVVLEELGTIDKYEGDAIIAFFGAPIDLPDHALRACVSAIIMKRREKELNIRFAEEGLSPLPLLTRIGVNTGSMVVGNMGTEQKMDYTIMGNAVNLAARLEGVNKQYGTWILASGDTVREAGESILSRRLDRVRVVGIHEPVQLYELVEMKDAASAEMQETVRLFHEALEIFEAKDWTGAQEGFEKVLGINPEDGPANIYRERCEKYRKTAP